MLNSVANWLSMNIMSKHIIRWLTYDVAFALIPLVCMLFWRYTLRKFTFEEIAKSPELLFFSLMVCATALVDLADIKRIEGTKDRFLEVFRSSLMLGAIMTAILFGALQFADVLELSKLDPTTSKLFYPAIWYASVACSTAAFVLALSVQVFVSKVEE